jgi:hypothetical protein
MARGGRYMIRYEVFLLVGATGFEPVTPRL